MVTLNRKVKAFTITATSKQIISLAQFKHQNLILFFYPKDNTAGCTTEAQQFRDHFTAFEHLNTSILGISRDSVLSHEKFKSKHQLPFELLSDTDETLCQYFNVIKEKNMYGRKFLGIERSTFLIDGSGILRKEW